MNPDPVVPGQEDEGDWIFNEDEVYGDAEEGEDGGENHDVEMKDA